MTRFSSTSEQSVPRSIRSTLVSTPTVRLPCGSTSFATCSASLLERSVLAAVMASTMVLGLRT